MARRGLCGGQLSPDLDGAEQEGDQVTISGEDFASGCGQQMADMRFASCPVAAARQPWVADTVRTHAGLSSDATRAVFTPRNPSAAQVEALQEVDHALHEVRQVQEARRKRRERAAQLARGRTRGR